MDVVEPEPRADRDRVHGDAQSRDVRGDGIWVGYQIGLRNEQHRARTALPGKGEVALEESCVEIGDRGHDEDDVDVRGDDLLAGDIGPRVVGGTARKPRPAREYGADGRGGFPGLQRDPVADDGQLGSGLDPPSCPARQARAGLALVREHVVGAAVLDGDAARLEAVGTVVTEGGAPTVVPAEHREVGHHPIVADLCRPVWKDGHRLTRKRRRLESREFSTSGRGDR